MRFLILSNDACPYEAVADDIYSAIIEFAKYVGDNSKLFQVAMHGVKTVEDGIRMFNHFSTTTITDIYGISCHYKEICMEEVEVEE